MEQLGRLPLPIPAGIPPGIRFACQWVQPWAHGCNLFCPPFFASDALEITVQ
jgi:hypothetical protein